MRETSAIEDVDFEATGTVKNKDFLWGSSLAHRKEKTLMLTSEIPQDKITMSSPTAQSQSPSKQQPAYCF